MDLSFVAYQKPPKLKQHIRLTYNVSAWRKLHTHQSDSMYRYANDIHTSCIKFRINSQNAASGYIHNSTHNKKNNSI